MINTDHKTQGVIDAINIIDNNADEIAAVLVKWRRGQCESLHFCPNEVQGADAWVHEGHQLSGMCIDMETSVAILNQVDTEYHETDSGQWDYSCAVDVVKACGTSTYSHYVECMVSKLFDAIGHRACEYTTVRGIKQQRFIKRDALRVIQQVLTAKRRELSGK